MTIKNDLKDVGYYLITPLPYRFEGVDYRRAVRNITVGGFALQVGLLTAIFLGPLIAEKVGDLKDKMFKKPTEK